MLRSCWVPCLILPGGNGAAVERVLPVLGINIDIGYPLVLILLKTWIVWVSLVDVGLMISSAPCTTEKHST